jgi:hypothetical protein
VSSGEEFGGGHFFATTSDSYDNVDIWQLLGRALDEDGGGAIFAAMPMNGF